MNILDQERAKYSEAWAIPEYSNFSPGEHYADLFMDIVHPDKGDTVLDFGAGSGKGSKALKERGLSVTAFDLVGTAWEQDDIHLVVGSLWRGIPVAGLHKFGFCCDVMEHIPTELTGLCIDNMLSKCGSLFLSISFCQDNFGSYLGQPLHLTVKPFKWWLALLSEVGMVTDARDLLGEGIFHIQRNRGIA